MISATNYLSRKWILRTVAVLAVFLLAQPAQVVRAADDQKPAGDTGRKGLDLGLFKDPEAVFKKMAEGKDKVSKEQFKKYFSTQAARLLKERPELLDRLFDRLDADKDGSLTLEEFKKFSDMIGKRAGQAGKRVKPEAKPEEKKEKPDEKKDKTESAPKPVAKAEPRQKPVDFAALASQIDQQINQRLATEKMQSSPLADDAEFLRRVYLDIIGVVPPADRAQAFLDDKDPSKRAKLVDELLASPSYGRHLADFWREKLLPRSSDNRRLKVEPLTTWLEAEFNSNKPWDKLVTDLLTASGPQDKNGAVTFFVANPSADLVTDKVCRLFLGVQLQCAQCHNHPFTGWKQTEYWAMAAFFTKVKQNANVNKAAKEGISPSVSEDGKGRPQKLPESAKMVPAKFLQGEQPKMESSAPYRPVLAHWLASADNPYFARAMANRMWAQLFGRGLVNPVDDMHDANPATHPELLRKLSEQFAANDFDLKYLVRAICNSQTYQRTSKPCAGNDSDVALYSHMAIKALSPEQLFDSLTQVVGQPSRGAARDRLQQNKRNAAPSSRAAFVIFFQTEDGASPLDYDAGIPQALRLMNSPQFSGESVLLDQAVKSGKTGADVIDRLYLGTLARHPNAAESQRLQDYLKGQTNSRKGSSDVLWALLNSSEFTLNH